MADPGPLASLSITHVYYDPEDNISYLCAYLALIPQALCVVYATLILTTREAEVVLVGGGQFLCEALNFCLKRVFKEGRPPRIHGKGYGMPSSHAQFVAFWASSVVLFLLVRHSPPPASLSPKGPGGAALHNCRPWSLAERALVSVAAVVLAAAVTWSRVYLGYHTPRQVAVGSAAGILTAVAWFAFTAVLRRAGLVAWALETPVARLFRTRDLVVEEDPCQAGWEKWEHRRLQAQQAKAK